MLLRNANQGERQQGKMKAKEMTKNWIDSGGRTVETKLRFACRIGSSVEVNSERRGDYTFNNSDYQLKLDLKVLHIHARYTWMNSSKHCSVSWSNSSFLQYIGMYIPSPNDICNSSKYWGREKKSSAEQVLMIRLETRVHAYLAIHLSVILPIILVASCNTIATQFELHLVFIQALCESTVTKNQIHRFADHR